MARRAAPDLFFCAACAVAAGVALSASTTHVSADPVEIRAARHDEFGRLMFFWPSPVNYETAGNRDRLVIRFERPIVANFDPASEALTQYVGIVEPDADGHSVVIPLRDGVSARSFARDAAVVVDLSKDRTTVSRVDLQTAAASEPGTPREPAVVRVRTGEHGGFSRIVFDWRQRVGYTVRRSGTSATVTFDHPARVDLRRLTRKPLKYIEDGSSRSTEGTAEVTLTVPAASQARHFRVGTKVVVDILGSDAAAAKTPVPSDAKVVEPETEIDESVSQSEATDQSTDRTPTEPADETPAPTEPSVSQRDTAAEKEGLSREPPALAPANVPSKTTATAKEPPIEPPTAGSSKTEQAENETARAAEWRFDWNQPVGAAVFRRAGALWIVFDAPTDHEIAAPPGSETLIRNLESIPAQKATALRMTTPKAENPSLERDGLAWTLRFAEQPLAPRAKIAARAEVDENGGMRLFLPVPEPGEPIAVTDPEVGDNLIVIPVIPLGHGVKRTYTYPQLRLLATAQGVVIQPFVDDLRVRSLPDGIEITAAADLSVSPVSKETEAAARVGSPEGLTRLLGLERWVGPDTVAFNTRRRALERAVINASPSEKQNARMAFARFFLAHAYAAEAFGALTLAAQHRPEIEAQPTFRAMRGVSQLLLGRVSEARDDLFHESLNGNEEASLWRAAVEATEGRFSSAAINFQDSVAITQTYPKPLRTKLNLLLAEAAIAADEPGHADTLMQVLETEVSTVSQKSALAFLRGRYLEAIGDHAGALETWSDVAVGSDRKNGAKASMASTELMLKNGDITRDQAIEALEALRYAWRGDALEVRLLRRLAQLYQEKEDYLAGLRTLRQVAAHFSADRQAPEITKQMSETFERLFLEGHATALPAVSTIALYREFQELTPTGDKGNKMIRTLADRLVEVDLLDDAADLLEKQVRYRLAGVERAKVGARLALVHLLNRSPKAALEALHLSAVSEQPEDLKRQRGQLAAQALSALGKPRHALSMLGQDDSLEAELIRTDIHWTSEDWKSAGQVLRRVLAKTGAEPGKPLSNRQAGYVLNLAVALTLAGDEQAVSRLREDHGAAMSASPARDAFRLIAGSETGGGPGGRDWSNHVKQAEKFQAYLAVYRAQLEHKALSTIN